MLFHVETEVVRRTEFRHRMWEYYSLLQRRTKKRVYPIVLYLSPGTGGIVSETYLESLFDEEILRFTYRAVGLPDLNADDYRSGENLVGVALSSLMRPGKVDIVLQKWEAVRKILLSRLDESRKILLTHVVETYLPLSGEQVTSFERLMQAESNQEVKDRMISIYEQRGIELGIKQGLLAGTQRTLLRQLEAKFGTLPETIQTQVRSISDLDRLESLSLLVLTASSLKEMGLE